MSKVFCSNFEKEKSGKWLFFHLELSCKTERNGVGFKISSSVFQNFPVRSEIARIRLNFNKFDFVWNK